MLRLLLILRLLPLWLSAQDVTLDILKVNQTTDPLYFTMNLILSNYTALGPPTDLDVISMGDFSIAQVSDAI